MYPSVKEVVPGDNYVLSILFDNGENGVLDMKPLTIAVTKIIVCTL